MKVLPNTIIKILLLLALGYLLSNIITREAIVVIALLATVSIVRWLFSFAFSLLFIVVKWACIIGEIALLASIIW
ncbi:hypothetical protein [Tenacibaculum jejuense]|uniref:hypothetical protein n=1 Tax=Tenacibaculum jejuense TaxID=584609 RepID=UPI001E3A5E34|nr:hypothetical protein [Tenacibaculum jejuense]